MVSPAGIIVSHVKDYAALGLIVIIVIVVYVLIYVAFPRLQGFSHVEDMDMFLNENDFMLKNIEGMFEAQNTIPGLSFLYQDSESFIRQKLELKNIIDTHFNGNIRDAFTLYFLLSQDIIKPQDKPSKIEDNGVIIETCYPRIYTKVMLYKKAHAEFEDTGLGENQKFHLIYKTVNVPSTKKIDRSILDKKVNKSITSGEYFLERIAVLSVAVNHIFTHVYKIIKILNDNLALAYLVTPEPATLSEVANDIGKHMDNLSQVYNADFAYTNVHEYSWYLFEVLAKPSLNIPKYNKTLDKLLINYLNSDYEKKQLARTKLIKNDELCDFLDKRPIWSKIYFTASISNKAEVYKNVINLYSSFLKSTNASGLASMTNNILSLKTFINDAVIVHMYGTIYQMNHKGFNKNTISSIYTEKYKTNNDFFMDLWKPYFNDFVVNRMVAQFKRLFSKEHWKEWFDGFLSVWEKGGSIIMNIPLKVAESIKQKRKKKKKEKFSIDSIEPLVIEGFLGKIFGPIIAVGKFFLAILKLTLMIVDLVMQFAKDPFGVLIDIFTLIFSMALSVILITIYALLSLPPIIYVVAAVVFAVTEVTLFIAYCIMFGALLILITVFCLILTIINVITRGKLAKMLLCENSPGAWYKTPNYHLKNMYERSLLCAKPCPGGYKPSVTGMTCEKLPGGLPSYCPQASIMRIYSGHKRTDRLYAYPDYPMNGNFKYETSLPSTREEMIYEHFKKGRKFSKDCSPMAHYDNVTKTLCSNIDAIRVNKPFGLTDNDIDRLEKVCSQRYCNSSSGSYGFCTKLNKFQDNEDVSSLVKNICLILFAVIMFTSLVILLMHMVNEH